MTLPATSAFMGKDSESKPLLLALETSGNSGSVALVRRDRCLAEYSLQTDAIHSKRLLGAIEFLLSQAQVGWPELDAIAISLGPGSFTGLRVGLSTAKGLAMATEKPLLGISTLDALASQFPFVTQQICAVIDARKKEVYAAMYAADGTATVQRRSDYLVLAPEALAARIDTPTILAGDGALLYRQLFRKKLQDLALDPPHETHFLRAAAVGRLALAKWDNHDFLSPATSVPDYIRASDADLGFDKGRK